jgi:sugar O-acyltransferase (sialic acid O-acetyltransferase NeuD family)
MRAERLVLVGAGDHGRGTLEILRASARAGQGVEVVGFVDDAPDARAVDGLPLLGTIGWLAEHLRELDAAVLLAIASPAAKRAIHARLEAAGARFGTAVHPRAEVAPSVTLGPGAIVNAGAVLVYEAALGAHVTVNLNATVGHHVRLGDYSTVAPGANLLGKVRLGEGAQVHANAVVLPGLSVGDGATVGAGSVVIADVPPGTTVFGNPARPVPAPVSR